MRIRNKKKTLKKTKTVDEQCSVSSYKRAEEEDGADVIESGDERRAGETAYRAASARNSGRIKGGVADAAAARNASPDNRLDFVVTVKYVRREIRTLTDQDRETFFNAVSVMQRVPSAVGQMVYGAKYYSKDYFNRLHLYYGECGDILPPLPFCF